MYVRLGFSVAINVDPDILLVDEVLSVGDANFQEKCMEKFADFRRSGKTVVIVSHAMGSLRNLCDEAAWLKHGELVDVGDTNELVESYIETGHVKRVATVAEAADGHRSGSGEVVLTKIELLDAVGEPGNTVHTADEVTFRMHYRASEPIERPLFALSIDTLSGVYVWSHNNRDGGCVPEKIVGEGSLDVRIHATEPPGRHLRPARQRQRLPLGARVRPVAVLPALRRPGQAEPRRRRHRRPRRHVGRTWRCGRALGCATRHAQHVRGPAVLRPGVPAEFICARCHHVPARVSEHRQQAVVAEAATPVLARRGCFEVVGGGLRE